MDVCVCYIHNVLHNITANHPRLYFWNICRKFAARHKLFNMHLNYIHKPLLLPRKYEASNLQTWASGAYYIQTKLQLVNPFMKLIVKTA